MDNNNYNILLTLGINKIITENYKKTSNSHSKLSSNLSSTTNNKYYDENDFNKLYFQLREKLNQKLYKKAILEIEHNIKKLKNINQIRKIQILKILALIKIINTKTKKYFYNNEINNINSFHLKSIKKYFYFINKEILNITKNFFETFNKNNCKEIINNSIDFIQDIFYIYFYYFNIMLKFYLILNDFKNISLYFIYSFKLFRFSYEFITNSKTLNKISNIFLLYVKFLIINREYEICVIYLEKIINICLKELMIKIKNIFNVNNNNNNIFKTIKNIIITLFYFGICYENMGKIKKSAECYKQCFWFTKKFLNKNNKDNFFYIFFKFIVERSINYNKTILYINKCINKKNNNIGNNNDNNNIKKFDNKNLNEKYEKKYKNLIHFIKNLNVNEINTINKYKYPKLYYKKTPFNHKEFNLNNLRLLEAYSSREFKNIIKDMKKINLYDIDNNLYNKIQKNYSKRFYDIFINNNNNKSESNNYKNNKINESCNNNNITSNINNINNSNNNLNNNNNDNNDNKKIYNIKLLNNPLKEKNLIFKKIFLKKNSENNNYNNINYINYSKNSSRIKTNNNNLSYSINNVSHTNFNLNKKIKKINISTKNVLKIENSLMKFSPINIREKSYKKKLKYISKLTDREFDFQKNLLSLKKHSIENEIKIFNKFEVKKNALNFFNKINILNNTINLNNNNSISNEEYHKMKINNNIENTFYKSLSNKSFIEYKKNLKNKKKLKNYYKQESEDENDINSFNKRTINLLDKNLQYIENNIRIKKKQLKNKKIFSNKLN